MLILYSFIFVGHEKIAKLIETYTPVPPTPPTKGISCENFSWISKDFKALLLFPKKLEVDSADKPVLERVMKFFFDKKKRESEEEE